MPFFNTSASYNLHLDEIDEEEMEGCRPDYVVHVLDSRNLYYINALGVLELEGAEDENISVCTYRIGLFSEIVSRNVISLAALLCRLLVSAQILLLWLIYTY